MRKDKAFRAAMEPLEDRVVMSKSLGVVGTLGDSYTDEYQFYPRYQTHARNWVEILSYTGKANFGPLSNVSRGEPRGSSISSRLPIPDRRSYSRGGLSPPARSPRGA
jgi:hypothetical protein